MYNCVLGHMFLPPVVSTPQVPRKMGSPTHEESVFYMYNIQYSNLLAATAAFWTFSQKFMKKTKKILFFVFFFLYFPRIWLAGACSSTKISCCWKRVRIDPLLDDRGNLDFIGIEIDAPIIVHDRGDLIVNYLNGLGKRNEN